MFYFDSVWKLDNWLSAAKQLNVIVCQTHKMINKHYEGFCFQVEELLRVGRGSHSTQCFSAWSRTWCLWTWEITELSVTQRKEENMRYKVSFKCCKHLGHDTEHREWAVCCRWGDFPHQHRPIISLYFDFRTHSCECMCVFVCLCLSALSCFFQSHSLLWISASGWADINICFLYLIMWNAEEKVLSEGLYGC